MTTALTKAEIHEKWLGVACKRLSVSKAVFSELESQAGRVPQDLREQTYLEILHLPLSPSVISQASLSAFHAASPATAVKILQHTELTKTQVNKTIALLFKSTDKLSTGHAMAAFFTELDSLKTFDFESTALHALNELINNGYTSYQAASCKNAVLLILSNKPKITKRLQKVVTDNFRSLQSHGPELIAKLTEVGFVLPT
jgi:hypothetical protein